jgi:hypothetical protein
MVLDGLAVEAGKGVNRLSVMTATKWLCLRRNSVVRGRVPGFVRCGGVSGVDVDSILFDEESVLLDGQLVLQSSEPLALCFQSSCLAEHILHFSLHLLLGQPLVSLPNSPLLLCLSSNLHIDSFLSALKFCLLKLDCLLLQQLRVVMAGFGLDQSHFLGQLAVDALSNVVVFDLGVLLGVAAPMFLKLSFEVYGLLGCLLTVRMLDLRKVGPILALESLHCPL